MGEDVRVPGQLLGPALERMTYADDDAADAELEQFWRWVAEFADTFPGDYDDLPSAFREPGTDALRHN
jgi:hypothetical protein